jgi:hypothetical protein
MITIHATWTFLLLNSQRWLQKWFAHLIKKNGRTFDKGYMTKMTLITNVVT